MVFRMVFKKHAWNQTIILITENGGSISTKIKKIVMRPIGSGAISRIPALKVSFSQEPSV